MRPENPLDCALLPSISAPSFLPLHIISTFMYSLSMSTHEMGTTQKNPENVRVGRTLHAFRERFGYTQDQLATEAGMSQSHLANIEAGRKPLGNRHLSLIADALGITPLAIKQFDRELIPA